jgi:cysteine desulfuration protein SufE
MDLQTLLDDFDLFEDWRERYQYLIDLGRKLPPLDDAYKIDAHLVRGCQSQVWLLLDSDGERLHLRADSDAAIVKGLCALIVALYEDRTLAEIAAIDVEAIFNRLGLHQHLSPNRRSGFFSMVQRVQRWTP